MPEGRTVVFKSGIVVFNGPTVVLEGLTVVLEGLTVVLEGLPFAQESGSIECGFLLEGLTFDFALISSQVGMLIRLMIDSLPLLLFVPRRHDCYCSKV